MKIIIYVKRSIGSCFGLDISSDSFRGCHTNSMLAKISKILEGTLKFGDSVGLGKIPSLYLSILLSLSTIHVITGLYIHTSLTTMITSMSVKFFIVYADDDFGTKEKSLLFLGMFIVIFFTGAGRYSVDDNLNK